MPKPETTERRRELLGAAQAYIAHVYREFDVGLEEVAEAVDTSPRHLQRVFREEGGEDFRSYLLRVRMTEAMRLITREKYPLAVRVACRRVGYRQASGLRQAFVRFYGYNPSTVQKAAPEELYAEPDRRSGHHGGPGSIRGTRAPQSLLHDSGASKQ